MTPYHVMMMHFPLALWTTAALIILLRAFSDKPLARNADRALTPLLVLSMIGGVIAYLIGAMVWPLEAVASSPLARNHVLLATWTLSYWFLMLLIRWRGGERVWLGNWRWIMLGLAALGVGFQIMTGAVGGSLAGNPSFVSDVVRHFGWELYTTFYLPNWVLGAVVVTAVALAVLGVIGVRVRRRAA